MVIETKLDRCSLISEEPQTKRGREGINEGRREGTGCLSQSLVEERNGSKSNYVKAYRISCLVEV